MVDKSKGGGRWDWVPVHMPGVHRQVLEYRRTLGDAHVNECWRKGVIEREPGWFFAREGAVAIGTPWGDEVMRDFAAASISSGQSVVVIRTVGGSSVGAAS